MIGSWRPWEPSDRSRCRNGINKKRKEDVDLMGEIRSTLDIIMEKAKDVQVTEEDRAAFARREMEGKIRGLVQRCLDGIMDAERLRSEMEALGEDRREIAVQALRTECLKRMALDGDNRSLMDLLGRVAGFDTKPVAELLSRYRRDREAKRADREAVLREQLTHQGISGSAVVPNFMADPQWIRDAAEASERFHRDLAGLIPES
jgi:uncharacterized protein (UPF0335 family)